MLIDNVPPYQLVALASVHAFAAVYMCGLIWFVQVVHYPLHGLVGSNSFVRYQAAHVRRTAWVVMVPMLVELVSALLLIACLPKGKYYALPVVGALLLLKAWVGTALLSVPAHRKLEEGFDAKAHTRLVSTNWVRTFAWTVRAPIAIGILILTAVEVRL